MGLIRTAARWVLGGAAHFVEDAGHRLHLSNVEKFGAVMLGFIEGAPAEDPVASRISRASDARHDIEDRLMQFLVEFPRGIHMHRIEKALGIPLAKLRNALARLERHGKIAREGTKYYPSGASIAAGEKPPAPDLSPVH